MTAFKVDFTQDDVSTTGAKGFEPLPSGFYEVDITDIEITEVKSGPNAGKPMFKVETTISEGEAFENRKLWFNVMLFNLVGKDGSSQNWFLAQFLKATGNGHALTTGEIPSVENFEGKHVTVSVRRKVDVYKTRNATDDKTYYKNEVNGFKLDDEAETPTTGKTRGKRNSLLP